MTFFVADCFLSILFDSVVKRNKVVVWLVEASGGIAPQPLARLHRNSRLAASRGARDRTKYGLSRASPRSYLTHHIQRIAFAAVRANAKHARWMITKRACARALKRPYTLPAMRAEPPRWLDT